MDSPFAKLVKVLLLEQRQGYQNKAVIGGLDKFASEWEPDALAHAVNSQQAAMARDIAVLLTGYPTVTQVEGRRKVMERIIADVRRVAPKEAVALLPENTSDYGKPPATSRAVSAQPAAPTQQKTPSQQAVPSAGRRRSAMPTGLQPASLPSDGFRAAVTALPGVGPVKEKLLQKLGVHTVADLIDLFPHRYEDYSTFKPIHKLRYGDEVSIIANVWKIGSRVTFGGRKIVVATLSDASGKMEATWFNPYVAKQLKTGQAYVFSGKISAFLGKLSLQNPQVEPLDKELVNTGRIVPVYPLTEGLSQKWLRHLMHQSVLSWAAHIPDYMPDTILQRYKLLSLAEAYRQIHWPANNDQLVAARRRFVFDELFFLQIGILRQREAWRKTPGVPLSISQEQMALLLERLPFRLTAAQERVLAELEADLRGPHAMSRLLQGDVGSGKTVVAAALIWIALQNRKQSALMAPTEILAEQHYRSLQQLFTPFRHRSGRAVQVVLLTGSLAEAEKAEHLERVARGEADIVIGTHALIQDGVDFHDLGFVVIDEQHRFGVKQRAALRRKGHNPHLLVMSATPIPRTLALTLYGDLDISVLDALPPGRQPIQTKWLRPVDRERVYSFIRHRVEEGRQAFIIYPQIEVGEAGEEEMKSAVAAYERLRKEVFPHLRLGLLHGKLPGKEKEAVMRAFAAGEIDVLVSTSVVEVGIDVPNASVMVVESADRFGLAQLHQFRGRVGRGEYASYCILIADPKSETGQERLLAMEKTQDGFVLAEKDLELRGPGDFFGVRQSGMPLLKMAQLSDTKTLTEAREAAEMLLAADHTLQLPEHQPLAERVELFWQESSEPS